MVSDKPGTVQSVFGQSTLQKNSSDKYSYINPRFYNLDPEYLTYADIAHTSEFKLTLYTEIKF